MQLVFVGFRLMHEIICGRRWLRDGQEMGGDKTSDLF